MAIPENMPEPRLSDLLRGLAETGSAMDCSVSSIAIDSRQVRAGGLFLACSGGDHHGMDFLHQALGNGVGAVAYEPDASWDEQRCINLVDVGCCHSGDRAVVCFIEDK